MLSRESPPYSPLPPPHEARTTAGDVASAACRGPSERAGDDAGAATAPLAASSGFVMKSWWKTFLLVKNTPVVELTQQQADLAYLSEKLTKLEDADITELAWLDALETWTAALALRSKLRGECAQQVLDAVLQLLLLVVCGGAAPTSGLPSTAVGEHPLRRLERRLDRLRLLLVIDQRRAQLEQAANQLRLLATGRSLWGATEGGALLFFDVFQFLCMFFGAGLAKKVLK